MRLLAEAFLLKITRNQTKLLKIILSTITAKTPNAYIAKQGIKTVAKA